MEINEILKKMEIIKNGNSNQPTSESYECYKCKDREFYEIEGVMYECECRAKKQYNRRIARAGLKGVVERFTLSNYIITSEEQKNALDLILAYYKGKCYTKENPRNLLILGQVGSGKTHLAMALANNIISKGYKLLYLDYRSFMTEIKTKLVDYDEYTKKINEAKNIEILYIDDLYKGRVTEADYNILYEIINFRYLTKKPTIVTSEKKINELISEDEGIGSRLFTANRDILINLDCDNFRLKK